MGHPPTPNVIPVRIDRLGQTPAILLQVDLINCFSRTISKEYLDRTAQRPMINYHLWEYDKDTWCFQQPYDVLLAFSCAFDIQNLRSIHIPSPRAPKLLRFGHVDHPLMSAFSTPRSSDIGQCLLRSPQHRCQPIQMSKVPTQRIHPTGEIQTSQHP